MRRDLIIVLLAVAAATLPFVNKPVHMDGVYFLGLAKTKLASPLKDGISDYDFAGAHLKQFTDTHPPFLPYYLAAVERLTGSSNEKVLHLFLVPFTLLAGAAAYLLARKFVRDSLFAALLLVISPGFVVMASDIMSDMPMLAFWLGSVASYVYGLDKRSNFLLALSGLSAALAFFTSYESLALIPLLLLYAIVTGRLSLSATAPWLAAAVIFCGYLALRWHFLGELPRLHPQSSASIFGPGISRFFPKVSSVFLFLGGAVVFPPAVLAAFWPRRKQIWDFAILVTLFVLFPALLALAGLTPWGQALQMSLFLPAAGLMLYGLAEQLRKNKKSRRNWIFLGLWLAGVIFYTGVLLYQSAVKYLLPAFFPIAVLLAAQARERFGSGRALLWFKGATLAATAVLTLLVAAADYDLAAGYRNFAQQPFQAEFPGSGTFWFTGEFGWRYYLEQHGFRYLLINDKRPRPGDIILQPLLPGSLPLGNDLSKRVEVVGEKIIWGNIPLKIINPPSGAGFYGHRWGLLPYSFSNRELDHVYIYKVIK